MNTPFGFNPFSTPRTPKGYKPLSSPDASPLARFNRTRGGKEKVGELGELPSLRVWKETCKAFHVNTTPSSIFSKTTIPKKNSKSKSKSKPPTSTTARPYGSFDRAMLLEDRDVFRVSASASDEEGEFGDSFNVYATKRRGGGVVKKTK